MKHNIAQSSAAVWDAAVGTGEECQYRYLPDEMVEEMKRLIPELEKHYSIFRIPKRGKGTRKITAPDDELKELQRKLMGRLRKWGGEVKMRQFSTGFMKGVSVADNAMKHRPVFPSTRYKIALADEGLDENMQEPEDQKSRWHSQTKVFKGNYRTRHKVARKDYAFLDLAQETTEKALRACSPQDGVRIDIKRAFDSTTTEMVADGLASVMPEIHEDHRKLIVDLCTFEGCLPTGAPTSPILLNMALTHFDEYAVALMASKLAKFFGTMIRYTRYADDITITTNKKGVAKRCIPFVESVAKYYGYKINRKKTRIMGHGTGVFITGINVVNSWSHVSVSRRERSRIRAAIHDCWQSAANADAEAFNKKKNSVMGRIAHVLSIDKVHGTKLLIYALKKGLIAEDERVGGCRLEELLYQTYKQKVRRHEVFSKHEANATFSNT